MAGLVLCAVMMTTGCGTSDPMELVEIVAAQLSSGTWKIQSVKVDGVDKTSSFTNFTLKFSGETFTSTNGNVVWPASGTLVLNGEATAFTRNDGVTVDIDDISDNTLALTLTWTGTTYGPGRVSSVGGEHKFTFTK